nr:MAG: FmdB family transcriptional regulator [Actinomycetota bacterium]
MPTYTYACSDCEERFDAVQSIHDDALTTCPACGGRVRRVISPIGVTFKGSGFYRTDSRAGSSSGTSSGSGSSGSGSSGSTNAGASPA